MRKFTTAFLFVFLFFSGPAATSVPGDSVTYRRMACGLYMDSRGNIVYKTYAVLNEKGKRAVVYLDHVYNVDPKAAEWTGLAMKFVVDTASFTILNEIFWRDKNRVYVFQPMSDGGNISVIQGADPAAFTVLKNTWYATCKNLVYFKSISVEGADAATFRTFDNDELKLYAYDKSNYYLNGLRLRPKEVKALGLEGQRK